jgi:hypothetical protein
MDTKVSQISVEELREIIGEVVEEKLRAILHDRDDDLELRDDLVERLERQRSRVEAGDRGEPFDDVVSRLGLN